MRLASLLLGTLGALRPFVDGAIVTTRRADGSSNNLRASSVVEVVDVEEQDVSAEPEIVEQSSHSTYEAYPLFSQHLYRIMQSSSSEEQSLLDQLQNAVFSYELKGRAKKRVLERRRSLQGKNAVKSSEPIAEYNRVLASQADESHGDGHGDGHDDAHSMVVHVTYEDIYAILIFLLVATVAGVISSKLGMPALTGEIFTGFLLGPPLADFVPYPEALVLIGEIGLITLLLEAGIELDVAQLRETGAKALAIGLTGTVLPLAVGLGLAIAQGATSMKSALAVGASFSPTSLGVAGSALKSGKIADTPVGQLIVAACVVDDILALILLSIFQVLVKDSPSIIEYFLPIISSVGFLIVLGGSAVTWMPKFIENRILAKVPENYRDFTMFSIMALMLSAYLPLMYYTKASYLMGAFLTGCSFALVDGAYKKFMHKMHDVMIWLLRVFFAASIGFQVPVTLYSDPYVVGWGFIMYACIIAKMPLGLYVPQFEDKREGQTYNPLTRDRLITGLSMTCRGEMSFIIASFALGEGLFPAKIYAAITWAVLLSCITSPFMLLNLIKYYNKKQRAYLASTNPLKQMAKGGDSKSPLFLHVKVHSPAQWGLQEKFRDILHELDLEVVERRTNRDGRGLDATVSTDLYVRDKTMSIHLLKIKEQRKIKRALKHDSSEESANLCMTGSFTGGTKSLSSVSLKSLEKDEQNALENAAKEDDEIIERCSKIEKAIEALFGEGTTVEVVVWNPFPWDKVLDEISKFYNVEESCYTLTEKIDFFMGIFDDIDTDGGGEIDRSEMFQALENTGLNITEEGVMTLFAMIDEDGNGDIDKDEWRTTVEFYFELKGEVNLRMASPHYSRMESMASLTKFEKGGMIDQMTAVSELDEEVMP